jgi:hypothetical protein
MEMKKPFRYRFDFEIGYLVKSPCRACASRSELPRCQDACQILDRIHEVMAQCVASTQNVAPHD